MKRMFSFTIILLVTTLISCKKDRDETSCALTLDIIAGTYKVTGLKYKPSAASPGEDYYGFMDDCIKDNPIQLNSNGTYIYFDEGQVCSPNGSSNGTWSITGNQFQSDGPVQGTVDHFNCTTLVYYIEDSFAPGDRLIYTITRQ